MAYKAISSYGIVGDLQTSALINRDGAVDWLCLPRFDSPSIFGAILDDKRGGSFRIAPSAPDFEYRQLYKPDTNILVTRFISDRAIVELTDFMPMHPDPSQLHASWLIRRVRAVSGSTRMKLLCDPGFHYAKHTHEIEIVDNKAVFSTPDIAVQLLSPVALNKKGGAAEAEFVLEESQTLTFVAGIDGNDFVPHFPVNEAAIDEIEQDTTTYWRRWLRKCTYGGRWRGAIHRSALLLELLTYSPSGAIIAAPTCSLPEWIGGERNWDYRYNWIRDSAYTIYALLRIGFFDEASRFMSWIEQRCAELAESDTLQTVYAVDGSRNLEERIVSHLEGYRGSAPVRVGNQAYSQVQLDIYGALIDAIYLYNKYAEPITAELWKDVRRLVNWVCDNWQQEDRGIWEIRGEPRALVHSKMMCWVAVDRGLRLSIKRSLPCDQNRWLTCRDQIYEEILAKGWSRERQAFVQSYGSKMLDASVLMMPLVFFMAPNDPMMRSTVDAIFQPLSKGGLTVDGMVYRYAPHDPKDGLPIGEGTFNVCTLWLIEALTRMGRVPEARWLFEKMLSRANHLGLYSEEMSATGEQLGNFPQAFTHMGLISAAFNLDRAIKNQAPETT
jgi:GH15 family glucan-1,4-alpha-glucosidase